MDGGQVKQFWTQWPKAKVIIATGEQHMIAVTARGQKGQQALNALIAEHDKDWQETIEFRGRRRRIYLLEVPQDAAPDGRVKLAEGVAVHGRGSFIIVPRNVTRHPRYNCLYDREIAPAPRWLLTLLGFDAEPVTNTPEDHSAETASEEADTTQSKLPLREFDPDRSLQFGLHVLDLKWIVLPKKTPPCDAEKVRAVAESYRITGVRQPLAVRELPLPTRRGWKLNDQKFRLLSDPYQLEALKQLGIEAADCFVIKGSDDDERLWKLAQFIHRPDVPKLDWAIAVMEWVGIIRERGVQLAHPRGGRQPHDKGRSAAQRILGVTRRDLGRAEKIASICAKAQKEARAAKLEDNQTALLEIAKQPPKDQVKKVLELKDWYAKPRVSGEPNTGGQPNTRDSQHQHRPRNQGSPIAEPPPPHQGQDQDQEQDQTEEQDWHAESPSTVPSEPSNEREFDNAKLTKKFKSLKAKWTWYLSEDWEAAPAALQIRFITEVLGYSVVVKDSRAEAKKPAGK